MRKSNLFTTNEKIQQTTLTIQNGVKKIEECNFLNCTNLNSIILPNVSILADRAYKYNKIIEYIESKSATFL